MSTLQFKDQKLPSLDHYATLAEKFIPARHAIFTIIEAAFVELLEFRPAKVLVVGAGGGEEIVRLAQKNQSWSFIGVDTYEPMIELAHKRISENVPQAKYELAAIPLSDLEETDFDAATCILTAHFVPDDGSKLALFKDIRARLKPGAPLAIVDGVGTSGEPRTELMRRFWKQHALLNGADPEMVENNAENFRKVAVVSTERELELLAEAGFSDLQPIFKALAIEGWLAFA